MTEEELEQNASQTASEPEGEPQDATDEPKMVPLAALEAERRKRQEAEAKSQLYQGYLLREKEKTPEPEEDPHALVEKGFYLDDKETTKRELREEIYKDLYPKAVQEINTYLNQILEKKPWLADSLDAAPNRYARASEIVEDYKHLVTAPKSAANDAKKMVDNSLKPRSPATMGKSAQPSGSEYLKSIQGTKEFREYRQKVRLGKI